MPPAARPTAPPDKRPCFAVCAPGLEAVTARELKGLGLAGAIGPGGISFTAGQRDLYRANLHARTASRFLVRAGAFYAAAFSELRQKAGRVPWEHYLRPGQSVAIKATCHKSKLYHSGAVEERVAGAIADRLGQAPSVESGSEEAETPAAQLVLVRLVRDQCTISIDSSGALLHQRGYRLAGGKAPLRETLAAGMLLAAEWDARSPLLDPFCGSGTIAIEGALLARRLAPGRGRSFAFMDWPDYEPALWTGLLEAAQLEAEAAAAPPIIQASDRDAGAIAAAQANAQRAGVADAIEFTHRAISAIEPPAGPGWVVTNPPYGVRLEGRDDLRNLYAQFGNTLRLRCPGWRAAFLCASLALARATGLPLDASQTLPLVNGGLRVQLFQARVAAS
ncbi:MAG: class I SAM-dependent RNA methyltransferase [Anaerolineales bacterium]